MWAKKKHRKRKGNVAAEKIRRESAAAGQRHLITSVMPVREPALHTHWGCRQQPGGFVFCLKDLLTLERGSFSSDASPAAHPDGKKKQEPAKTEQTLQPPPPPQQQPAAQLPSGPWPCVCGNANKAASLECEMPFCSQSRPPIIRTEKVVHSISMPPPPPPPQMGHAPQLAPVPPQPWTTNHVHNPHQLHPQQPPPLMYSHNLPPGMPPGMPQGRQPPPLST